MASYGQALAVREAIKKAMRWNRVARDTRNGELYHHTCNFIATHWNSRHSSKIVILTRG